MFSTASMLSSLSSSICASLPPWPGGLSALGMLRAHEPIGGTSFHYA